MYFQLCVRVGGATRDGSELQNKSLLVAVVGQRTSVARNSTVARDHPNGLGGNLDT